MKSYPNDIIKSVEGICIEINIPSTVNNCVPIMDALVAERERCVALVAGFRETTTEGRAELIAAIRSGGYSLV